MKLTISQGLKIALFIAFSIALIEFLEYKIETDLRFHSGKDGGAFVQFESVFCLSILFHILMGQHFLTRLIIGVLVGFVTGILGYFICYGLLKWDFPFQYISLAIILIVYFLMSKIGIPKKTSTKT